MRHLENYKRSVPVVGVGVRETTNARWNLSDLYASPDSPAVQADMEKAVELANTFRGQFENQIKDQSISAAVLATALVAYEEVLETTYKPFCYASLLHSADSALPAHGKLLAASQEALTEVQTILMFFELDWITLSDEVALSILESDECRRWRHFLLSSRRYKPHTLTEPEEIVLAEKRLTGIDAFRRLFDEITSAARFQVEIEGDSREMTQSEILSLLYDSDRNVRKTAHEAFTRGLRANSHLASFILNTSVKDHAVDSRLKNFGDPASSRHLDNEINEESFNSLLIAVEKRQDIVERYYRLKAKLLGLPKLYDYDRYAPIMMDGGTAYSCKWETACELVSESYHRFSPVLGEIVDKFLSQNWVDAEPRSGKRGGAFCSATIPSVHPYILVNFNGKLNDVMTLAHELGHGVHQYLAREQGILQFHTPLTLAETASIFGEMLIFDKIGEKEGDPHSRLPFLCRKLEDSFATVFRQIVLTRFEERVHSARGRRELSSDDFDRIWLDVNTQMHGDALELTPEYGQWWSYIGHFVHSPFYCYAYAFGELLVFSLWSQYRSEGKSFVPRYIELLRSGGTDSPQALVSHFGLSLEDPKFWDSGLSILEELLVEAETLVATLEE